MEKLSEQELAKVSGISTIANCRSNYRWWSNLCCKRCVEPFGSNSVRMEKAGNSKW